MTLRTTTALVLAAALSAATLAGCSDDSSDSADPVPTTTSASAPPTSSTEPDSSVVTVDITIDDRTITPAPSRVKIGLGDTVRLTVTSDVDDELHVHGYDVEADLPAGQAVTEEFVADQAGLFEVETHESPTLLLTQLQVQ